MSQSRRLLMALMGVMIIIISLPAAAQTSGGNDPRPGGGSAPATPTPRSGGGSNDLEDSARRSGINFQTQTLLDGFVTIDVPVGWQVYADVMRDIDLPVPYLEIVSPDEQTYLLYGLHGSVAYVAVQDDHQPGDLVTLSTNSSQQYEVRAATSAEDFFLDYIPGNLLTFDDCLSELETNVFNLDPREIEGSDGVPAYRIEGVMVQYLCESEGGYESAEVFGELFYQAPSRNYLEMWGIWRTVLILTNDDPQEAFDIALDIFNSMDVDREVGRRLLDAQPAQSDGGRG